jgi:hypothetical protein
LAYEEGMMTIRLDHTIVPAKDKIASAEFFAEIFGLTVKQGYFAQVQVNENLPSISPTNRRRGVGQVSIPGRAGAITTPSMSARGTSRRSSAA